MKFMFFSIKYRYILLKNIIFIFKRSFCRKHTCYCVNMVYMTSASRYHPRYQSRSSMYIQGLIPRNFAELAEAVPIETHYIRELLVSFNLQTSNESNKVAKIRNRYNQVPHLTQDTNGKVTNSQKTPQTRAKRSALSQQVTTKHI